MAITTKHLEHNSSGLKSSKSMKLNIHTGLNYAILRGLMLQNTKVHQIATELLRR